MKFLSEKETMDHINSVVRKHMSKSNANRWVGIIQAAVKHLEFNGIYADQKMTIKKVCGGYQIIR